MSFDSQSLCKSKTIGFYFDVGGVLIPDKFGQNPRRAFRQLLRRYPSLDPERAYLADSQLQPELLLGLASLGTLCAAIGIDQPSFEHEWITMHPIDQSVLNTIEQLTRRGYRVGLATNFCGRLLRLLLKKEPLLSTALICCSSEIGAAKPAPEFFQRASDLMRTSQTIFVDDRMPNVQAAREYGWTAILARGGWLPLFRQTYLDEHGCG